VVKRDAVAESRGLSLGILADDHSARSPDGPR